MFFLIDEYSNIPTMIHWAWRPKGKDWPKWTNVFPGKPDTRTFAEVVASYPAIHNGSPQEKAHENKAPAKGDESRLYHHGCRPD